MERVDRFTNDFLIIVLAFGLFVLALAYAYVESQLDNATGVLSGLTLAAAFGVGLVQVIRKLRYQGRLTVLETNQPQADCKALLEQCFEEWGWTLVKNQPDHLIATTPSTLLTWGQEVAVVFEQGAVLANSRNSTYFARTPMSFGNNRRHLERIRAALAETEVAAS